MNTGPKSQTQERVIATRAVETVDHYIFHCERFSKQREQLER